MILQSHIPYDVHASKPLPGIQPMRMADWLIIDDAYAGQMALRDQLIAQKRSDVIAMDDQAHESATELLNLVLEYLSRRSDFVLRHQSMIRPDGQTVWIDFDDPLATVGRLTQADHCILQKDETEHMLTGAVLCFPASWTLSEKFMRPLRTIHNPVADYTDNIARRVQRLFDGVKADHPLWRFNALHYEDPALFQPRSETAPRPLTDRSFKYLRSERQSVLRLPKTHAVIFSIHTFICEI